MSLTLTLSPMRQSLSQMLSKARVSNNDAEVSKKHETTGTAATEAAKPVASALSILVGPIPASILSILMQHQQKESSERAASKPSPKLTKVLMSWCVECISCLPLEGGHVITHRGAQDARVHD
jgi:hypothetical protein